jgi:WD40 repeat protein
MVNLKNSNRYHLSIKQDCAHRGSIQALSFSNSGRLLASGGKSQPKLFLLILTTGVEGTDALRIWSATDLSVRPSPEIDTEEDGTITALCWTSVEDGAEDILIFGTKYGIIGVCRLDNKTVRLFCAPLLCMDCR